MRVVTRLMTGEDLTEGMYPEKRKMYLEIYGRVMEQKKREPEKPLGDIVFEVVNDAAPSSYLSWDRAGRIIKGI